MKASGTQATGKQANGARETTPRSTTTARAATPTARDPTGLLALQRVVGNRAVRSVLGTPGVVQQRAIPGASARKPSPLPQPPRAVPAPAHRVHPAGQTVSTSVSQVLASPGKPLDPAQQQDMQRRFGHDFSQVRVHADAAAEQSAWHVNANAYTVGRHMVFAPGKYAPHTSDGKRLLAHELVHTLQQRDAPAATPGPLRVSAPDDSHEVEADRISRGLSQDAAVDTRAPVRVTPTGLQVAREPTRGKLAAPSTADLDQAKDLSVRAGYGENDPAAYATPSQLAGDPVPGYEVRRLAYTESDIETFWRELHKRERDNKTNAGDFVGTLGEAMVKVWGRHVSEVMAKAGTEAGWSLFKKMLRFALTMAVNYLAAGLAGRASIAIFELVGKEITDKVTGAVVNGISVLAAHKLEKEAKQSELEVAQENIDKVTEVVGDALKRTTSETIKALPDITPYAKFLSDAERSGNQERLGDFRLPPLFPAIAPREIYFIVGETIVASLNAASAAAHDSPTAGGYVSVEGPTLSIVEAHVPSRHLRGLVGGKKVRDLSLLPLRIRIRSPNAEGIRPVAQKLLPHFRVDALDEDVIDAFIRATGEGEVRGPGYLLDVWRWPGGEITFNGGTWSIYIYLYQWATGDVSLQRFADAIDAPNSCPDETEESAQTACEIMTPAQIAKKMTDYLTTHENLLIAGARALITRHIENQNAVTIFPENEDE